MIPQETVALIRHLFYAEHWKIGTIASEFGLHYDTVRRAVEADRFSRRVARSTAEWTWIFLLRSQKRNPYLSFHAFKIGFAN